MDTKDKRKSERIDSLNLSYVLINGDTEPQKQTMGRTLNVSENGILLETHLSVAIESKLLLSIGLGEELVDIKGRVVHSAEKSDNKFEMGVEFLEKDKLSSEILQKFIEAFKKEENK